MCQDDVDLGFIIDGSGSIRDANPADGSYDNWNLLLDFVAKIIDGLPKSGTKVAGVVFSDRGELLFDLNEYSNLMSAKEKILQTKYLGRNTNTSGGLWVAQSRIFTEKSGDRPDVPNMALVITDGKSTFDSQKTIPLAEGLRQDGVQIISVGVTDSVDETELKGLSSPPHVLNQNYFTSPDFRQLDKIIDKVLSSACTPTNGPTRPSPPPGMYHHLFKKTRELLLSTLS